MVATNGSVHKIEASWDQFVTGDLPASSPAQQLFTETVIAVAAQAKAALGSLNGRVDKARDLVLAGLVERQADYSFVVRSATKGQPAYIVDIDGHCNCADATKRGQARCKHTIATWIWRRARQAIAAQAEQEPDAVQEAPALPGTVLTPDGKEATLPPAPPQAPATGGISPEYVIEIHGKKFVRYAGLLQAAHARGLVSLRTRFLTVTESLALAESEAVFADGAVYHEVGDATPGNVAVAVKAHYPRVAATRAAARALRNALGCELAAVEELES